MGAGSELVRSWFESDSVMEFGFYQTSENQSINQSIYLSIYSWCGLSATLECRPEMCCMRLAENTGRKKVAKNRHLGTIPQICRAVSSQLRHVWTIGKKLLSSNTSSRCPPRYSELRPTNGWDQFGSLGHPANFNGFRVLAALLHGSQVVSISQSLRRWTEGATYVRQGDHHVGHWPTV